MPREQSMQPTMVESWLEARFPGYRFGAVLVLLSVTFVVMAAGPPDAWVRVLTVALEGLTLLAALLAARVGRRLFRIASLVVGVALVSSIVSVLVASSREPTGFFFALNVC